MPQIADEIKSILEYGTCDRLENFRANRPVGGTTAFLMCREDPAAFLMNFDFSFLLKPRANARARRSHGPQPLDPQAKTGRPDSAGAAARATFTQLPGVGLAMASRFEWPPVSALRNQQNARGLHRATPYQRQTH